MTSQPSPAPWTNVLRHPIFLAGLAVVLLLGLTAAVLIVFDAVSGNGSEGAGSPTVVVAPAGSTTPGPVRQTAVAGGVIGRTVRVTSVRTAPGSGSPILGTLPSSTDIEIDGRTTDSNWYRVLFPPNSEFHGWIDAEDLDITGNAMALVVATAEPPPVVALPTDPPEVLTAVSVAQTEQAAAIETGTPTPTPTPGGAGLPDLVVGTSPVLSGNQLFVTVMNQGSGDAMGDIVVAVFNPDGTALLGGATLPNFSLPAGRSIDIATGFVVDADQTLLLIVDPNGTIEESDNTNNQVTVAITGVTAPPTQDPLAPPPEPPTEIPPPPP